MSSKKSCALEEKHNSLYIVPFRPAFGEARKTNKKKEKENYFYERKSKCMSMRCHRASLFVEQSVFLPGRPKNNKNKLTSNWTGDISYAFYTWKKWSSLRVQTSHITTFCTVLPHSRRSSDSKYIYLLYLLYNSVPNINKRYKGIDVHLGPRKTSITSTAGSSTKWRVCVCLH